jgi:hypothetical protein
MHVQMFNDDLYSSSRLLTSCKNVSCPDNKGLLVPSSYQETMIQHILYVFVVVANFYDSHFSICDVLVFQSKKKLVLLLKSGKDRCVNL